MEKKKNVGQIVNIEAPMLSFKTLMQMGYSEAEYSQYLSAYKYIKKLTKELNLESLK
jgi:hypothetical protein